MIRFTNQAHEAGEIDWNAFSSPHAGDTAAPDVAPDQAPVVLPDSDPDTTAPPRRDPFVLPDPDQQPLPCLDPDPCRPYYTCRLNELAVATLPIDKGE